ncbi:MAG: TetR/AcrR family transcriptional regulator [Coriobacteriia bacterium]|nr:TetR/AcrR family transcriptional regulator [Coriobacteriia bacterium]
MGLDARTRYTRMVIRESFLALLEEQPVNKITVKAVCEGAQINRATFYRYYQDAFDLLDKLEEELLEGLLRAMRESIEEGMENTLEQILCTMREHAQLYRVLCANGDPELSRKVFKTCYGAAADFIAQRHPALPESRRAWLYSYVAQGAGGVLDCWIAEGMADDPKEVAAFMERLIESSLTAAG